MKHTVAFLFILFLLIGCDGAVDDGITVTPPVVESAVGEAPAPTVVPVAGDEAATAVASITLAPIVTSGLSQPLYLTHAGDDRLFVVEKGGAIRIIRDGVLAAEPFLDISDRVNSGASERGLLGLAFHPGYGENGRFFVNYTDQSGHTVISAFQTSADPDRADPSSELILLTIPQPYPNHNGGLLKFGPDGYLYVGMGDGGAAGDPHNHGQNGATLLGALLRLDVDAQGNGANYAVPADNPFIADGGIRNEIWATGLRNPWRFSFDRLTGDLYIADVGQNQIEEISFLAAGTPGGANFGWAIMEGSECYGREDCDPAGLVLPLYEYANASGRCSITGGYVYRGEQFPALRGNYFFGDYCSGEVWRLVGTAVDTVDVARVAQTNARIASFGEDAQGELYVIDISGGVYQIQP
jgi:glucose/arabinose dehydrogenase